MQERRRYIRFDTEGSPIFKTKEGKSFSIKTDLVDISFGGIGIYTRDKIEAGSDVTIELTTKIYDEVVICEGKIKYALETKRFDDSNFRIGIEFSNIDTQTIRNILSRIQGNICTESRRKRTF